MIRLAGLDHIVLRVKDLERMIAFYCDVIGCTLEWRRDDLGLVHLRAGRALIDLVPVDGPLGKAGGAAPGAEAHNMDHFCLQVADFDASAIEQHLRSNGVPLGEIKDRYGATGRGTTIYLQDPEGNRLELKAAPSA